MLPYVRVSYIFGAARVSAPSITYYGCVTGKARRLHDLVSKGYFTPGDSDCGSGEDYAVDYSTTEFDIPAVDYPALISGNRVDPDTVKVYMKDLTYLGLHKAVSGALNAGNYVGIPVTYSSVRMAAVSEISRLAAGAAEIRHEAGSNLQVHPGASALVAADDGKIMVPGTLAMKVVVPLTGSADDVELLLTDIPHDGTVLDVGTLVAPVTVDSVRPVTGQLYVYGPASGVTVISNSLMYEWNENTLQFELSGYIGIDVTDFDSTGTTTVAVRLTDAEVLPASVMYNFKNGDTLLLGKRGYSTGSDANGVQNVLNLTAGTSVMQVAGSDADFLPDALRAVLAAGTELPSPDLSDSSYCGFDITAIDYAVSTLSGVNMYDASEMDYRPHPAAALCIRETDRTARRLLKNDHYTIVESGTESELAQITIDPSTMIISTRIREASETSDDLYSSYAPDYDSDPALYPAIVPTVGFPNFVTGDLRIEYEEEVISNVLINRLFKLSEVNSFYPALTFEEALVNVIGQYDPRNYLGFAVNFVRRMTTTDFYILAHNGLDAACDKLTTNRFILHVWNVADEPSAAFTAWIANENLPVQSRFRIGYQGRSIPTEIERISPDLGYAGTLTVNPTSGRRTFTSSTSGVNFLNLSVNAGDQFILQDGTVYTVEFVSSAALAFSERFSRTADYNAHPMTASGISWNYTFSYSVLTDSVKLKFKVRRDLDDQLYPVEGTVAEINAITDMIETCSFGSGTALVTPKTGYTILPAPKVSAIPAAAAVAGYQVKRVLSPTEQVNLLVSLQTSTEPANVTVLSGGIKYKNTDGDDTFLPDYACAGIIFQAKIALLPHMPLTEVVFDTFSSELGEVTGLANFKRTTHLELLGDAGYCMINSEAGGKPYCESDFTTGYKLFRETDRGLLSKIHPILLYGKDVYEISRPFKGPVNTDTPELISLINVTLAALRDKYLTTKYPMLGSLLKDVAVATLSFDGSFTVITHRINSQDPSRYIDHIVYVGQNS